MSKEAKVGYKKNIGTILLLSFAGSIIYGLPYFRSYYYDTYQAMYHLTNTQMGLLGSAYGVLGVFSYIIGGVLADKIKAKKLLIFSMIATGLGGLLHLFVNNFYALVVIYGLWGVTSLLTFWPALMKIVRIQATEEEQSRAYGTFEGGRGVFNAAHLAVATAIFGIFQRKAMPTLGIKGIIWFYSLAPLIVGIIFIFLLKEPETVKEDGTSSTVSFKDIIRVLKMPVMWLIIIMMYTSYTFNMSSYYFTPYASNIIGVTAVIAAILTVMSQYIRPFAATLGGFSGDKFGRSHTMIVGYILMIAGVVIMDVTGKMASDIEDGTTDLAIIDVAMYNAYQKEYNYDVVANQISDEDAKAIADNSYAYYIFPKDQEELRDKVDEQLKELKKDGTLTELSQKYFGQDTAPEDDQFEKTPN